MKGRRVSAYLCGLAISLLCLNGCASGGGNGGNGGGGSGGGGNQAVPLVFAAREDLSNSGNGNSHLVIADFNRDGKLDIAVSGVNSSPISVFLNKGDGTFTGPIVTTIAPAEVGFGGMVVGDFNEDGIPDLVVGPLVLLGNGDGTFHQGPALQNPIIGAYTFQVKAADFNGDGHLDLVQVGSDPPIPYLGGGGFIAVSLGNGDGTFRPMNLLRQYSYPGDYIAVAVADFNGDKRLDLLVCDGGVEQNNSGFDSRPGNLLLFAGNGDGTFQTPLLATTWNFVAAVVNADFTGNGKQDLLISTTNSGLNGPPDEGKIGILLGNGDGTFQSQNPISIPLAESGVFIQATDLDLDGKADALTANHVTGILTLIQDTAIGNPPSTPGVYQFTIAPGLSGIATGDLNGDGLPDIVVSNDTTQQISVFLSKKQ